MKVLFTLSVMVSLVFFTCGYDKVCSGNVVYASSKNTTLAKAHISHLYNSLHNNYLGLKNQGQWQSYIKNVRCVIASIPSSEKVEKDRLTTMVDSAERLVNSVARINQVEKSMLTNSPRMGNVRQWDFYLILGEQDLAKVDMKEFSKEIRELESRLRVRYDKVNEISRAYDGEYSKVLDAYNNADRTKSIDDAKAAYELACKLPYCEESNAIKLDCKMLLVNLSAITLSGNEKSVIDGYYKLQDILLSTGINVEDTREESVAYEIKKVLGNNIGVSATRVFLNKETGEEVFDILLYNGDYKLHPISIYFK